MALVSVIVPTWQRATLVGETLRSALAQTHRDVEVLVEDDGSTDGTDAVVAAIAAGDPRVRYAWSPNAGRPAPARNRAIRRARGEILAFLDSDDLWEPHKLERQLEALRREPALLGVSSDARTVPDRGAPLLGLAGDLRPSFEDLVRANVISNSGAVIRRAVLDEVGLLDESPELRAVEDYDLWLRILRHRDRSFLVLKEPLFRYRLSPDQISPASGRRDLELRRRVLEKHLDFRPGPIRALLDAQERAVRKGELLAGFRGGSVTLRDWLAAPEVSVSRRLRVAARALLLGRERA
jgi:glycosyltransferase involved in cell wall biosynthesis